MIRTASGDGFQVNHPDFLFIPTKRSDLIILENEDGRIYVVDTESIESLILEAPVDNNAF